MLVADECRNVEQLCRSALGFQVGMAFDAGLVPDFNESRAAAMFLMAGTAGGREQHAAGVVRRRVMAAEARLFRDRPEVHTAHASVTGIALLSERRMRRRNRPAGEWFRTDHPMRRQPDQGQQRVLRSDKINCQWRQGYGRAKYSMSIRLARFLVVRTRRSINRLVVC